MTRLPLLLVLGALLSPLFAPTLAGAQVRRPMPVVQRIEPTSGPPGTLISLIGRYFGAEQTIWLGDAQLEVQSRLPNRWTATVPEGARSGNLEIRTPRGNVRGPRFRVTQAAPAPAISGFEPETGAAGTEVVIEGEHFSPRLAENQVRLGDRPVVVRSANPNALRVIIPGGAASGAFSVHVDGAGSVTSEASFTIGTGTSVSGFEPALGPPRTRVTLTGTGFHRSRARNRVYLGEQRARVLRASETELVVEVPRRDPQSGRWLVDVRGAGRAYSEREFQVRYEPVVREMSPSFGAPGTRVTLIGDHFGSDVRQITATLGETNLVVRDLSAQRLVVEVPQGATDGRIAITVAGLGPARAPEDFDVVQPVSVTAFSPRSGGAGTEVTITGRGFSAEAERNTVTLSGQRAEVVRASAEELVVRVPEAASGALVVAVANAGEDRTQQPFVVTRVPVITSFSPAQGPAGTAVTIEGRNFGTRTGLVRVQIGDRNAQVVSASGTALRVVIPSQAATGRLRVTVRLQGSAESDQDFTVTDSAPQ